ncbi:unnamed protein product, partial [Ectocarpus sp. 8 AP-2014]
SAPEAKRAQFEQYKEELSRDGSIGDGAASTDGSGAVSASSAAGDASLDMAKSHASDGMSGIAGDAENEGATTKRIDATTGGGDGSGSGGGGGGGGNTVADKVDVEAAHTLLAMRSGSAGEASGASSLTELDELMSSWSTSAPAVFPSLVSPAPEGDATAELLELIGKSGDSDYLLD